MYFFGFEMNTATNDTMFIDHNLIWNSKGDDLGSNFYLQVWKIVESAVGPFEFHVLERGIFASDTNIFFDFVNRATDSAIYSMRR